MSVANLTRGPLPALRSHFLDVLGERVVVFDGAMGTSIQSYNPSAADYGDREGCNEYLVLNRPRLIEEIHASFLAVGCDVLETNTFGGNRLKLAEYELEDRVHEMNVEAARLARRIADRYATPDHPRFVAGSIGPTGMLPSTDDPTLGKITFAELTEIFAEQAQALVEGGCDLLIIETSQDILEVKAAIVGIARYFRQSGRRVPIQAQVTLDTSGRMLLGTDIAAAQVTLESLPVQVIGLNCSTGPEHMREPVRYLCENARLPISVIPNAGLPLNQNGQAVYPLAPEEMATALAEFVSELGVAVVGGCCGTTPAHLKLVVEAVGGKKQRQGSAREEPRISSGMRATTLRQDPPPLLVGERVNAQGSRRVKRLLLRDDYDGILDVARQQVDVGAHVLDVCVALTERSDEAEQMRRVVKKLTAGIEQPLCIDSTEPEVIRIALENYPGRAIVNSINMENGRERIDRVLPLVVEHGAAVVALTIDESGMAKTADRKVEVARRIHQIATDEFGLRPDALIFDALTFTLATGQEEFRRSAIETIEGIRRIKQELPGVLTVLGVSNVSFGAPERGRAALNSVFLYHAVQAGLDLAIIHPADVTPYAELPAEERELCEDLIYDRGADALPRFIEHFAAQDTVVKDAGDDPAATMTVEERIHYQILHRKKEGIEALLDQALLKHSPVEVINEVLLPAMKDVGDRFGAGELILPFVLQSAEVMKRAVGHIEQFLEKREGYTKGKVVLATVFGDVHDIGKNLVNTILTNNGYTVYDLGKQVPLNKIVDTAVEVQADAIGLSALLVSTSKQMPLCVQELHRRGLKVPVLIGGAAINRHYGRRILFVDEQVPYEPGVFYARDAFEGLAIMDTLTDAEKRTALVAKAVEEARAEVFGKQEPRRVVPVGPSRKVSRDVPIPTPPFWGARVVDDVPLPDVFDCLDLNTLFRLHWGGKVHGEEFERLVRAEFQPRLDRMQREAIERGYLTPRIVYGYFPCQSSGEELVVYAPDDPERELSRLSFPRQPSHDRLCLSDYFATVESGRRDVVAFQVVTAGETADDLSDELQQAGEYAESYFVHGFATQCAEALAEYAHRQVRRELGLPPEQGKRYSWGYPACPDLEEQVKVWELLSVAERIGVTLTEGYQLVPEQSTAAMVVHHPEAIYYSVR